jgi:hypothetical protein
VDLIAGFFLTCVQGSLSLAATASHMLMFGVVRVGKDMKDMTNERW